MTDKERDDFLYDFCERFDKSMTLDKYKNNIRKYLILCSWHYTEKEADKIVKKYDKDINQSYKKKETIGDVALDIGFSCG